MFLILSVLLVKLMYFLSQYAEPPSVCFMPSFYSCERLFNPLLRDAKLAIYIAILIDFVLVEYTSTKVIVLQILSILAKITLYPRFTLGTWDIGSNYSMTNKSIHEGLFQ